MRSLNLKRGVLALVIFATAVIGVTALAQTRHPRVAELEKTLSREGLELMKGRFPGKPFLVTVKIDPMVRDRRPSGEASTERLPYLDLSEEEVVDEWDDPQTANAVLLNRVKKILVSASIPSNLTDDEIAELKTTLVSNLGLLEARDSVEVNKRNWGALDQQDPMQEWRWLRWAAGGFLVLMLGFFGLFWFGTSRLSSAFKESAATMAKASGGPPPPVPQNFQANSQEQKQTNGTPAGGDLKFNDPIKMRELMISGVRILEAHPDFPRLEDMVLFDRFGKDHPHDLGALLAEFTSDVREKIFSLSSNTWWLEGMNEPGEVTPGCVDVINKCLRLHREGYQSEWNQFMIYVWRMNDDIKELFRGLSQNDAFPILVDLPKFVALEVGRELYPGAWGLLLDPNYKPEHLSLEKIGQLQAKAIEICPLRDLGILSKYKNEKELLAFLKTADPLTEQEVYKAAGEQSMIWNIRPPFFRVLEMKPEEYDQFVARIRIEDWAMATLNVVREKRREIEKRFSEKQRFRYFEMLKNFDLDAPSKARIGETRENIGRAAEQFFRQINDMKNRASVSSESKVEDLAKPEGDDQNQAA